MTLAEADASTAWVSAHAGMCAGLIYASAEPRFREEFFANPGACVAWSNLPRVTVTGGGHGRADHGQLGVRVWMHRGDPCRRHGDALPAGAGRPAPRGRGAGARGRGEDRGDLGSGGPRRNGQPRGALRRGVRSMAPHVSVAGGRPGLGLSGGDLRAGHLVHRHLRRRHPPGAGAPRPRRGAQRAARQAERFTQKPVLENPATQRGLEAAEGLWLACRAGMRETLAAMWACALRGEPATADLRVNARSRR